MSLSQHQFLKAASVYGGQRNAHFLQQHSGSNTTHNLDGELIRHPCDKYTKTGSSPIKITYIGGGHGLPHVGHMAVKSEHAHLVTRGIL
jgi:hypothetical protein